MKALQLILYRKIEKEDILKDMLWLMNHFEDEEYPLQQKEDLLYQCIYKLVEFATEHELQGDLWNAYLIYLLINDENPYSLGCEKDEILKGTLNHAAIHDFIILKGLMDYDFTDMGEYLQIPAIEMIFKFEGSRGFNQNEKILRDTQETMITVIKSLVACSTSEVLKDGITTFYQKTGVGKLGLHKAFRIEHDHKNIVLTPILNNDPVRFDDLIGYEIPKKKLIDNTEAFIEGRSANNCLLFGDAGTGKSSSVKALLNQYYDKGLRIIELYKHQFKDLNAVIEQVRDRNYHFIIYMDDLSFEDFEIEYKYLKAVIEGGIESKPDNVLIYATSNRRHLIREKFSDKEGRRDDLHASDTVQEKLSLSARFGVNIFFCAPEKKEFQQMVKKLAIKNNIHMKEEKLLLEANKWELSHGGLSGRTAQQFMLYLLSQE